MEDHRPLIQLAGAILFVTALAVMIAWKPSSHVRGVVLDSSNGRPVQHAVIVVARLSAGLDGPSPRRAQLIEVETDTSGHFAVTLDSRWWDWKVSTQGRFIVAAIGYEPISQSMDFLQENEKFRPEIQRRGNEYVVSVRPQATPPRSTNNAWDGLANTVVDLYIGASPQCRAREMPRLLRLLKQVSSVRLEPIDSRDTKGGEACAS